MHLLGKRVADITPDDLGRVVDSRLPEGRTVEYKSKIIHRDSILAEIVSFANAGGGVLLIGVDEEDREASSLTPIDQDDLEKGSLDEQMQQFEHYLRDSVEPRINGVQVEEVEVDGGYVFLFGVPRSWNAPHRIKSSRKFYTRTSAGKLPMDIPQIRDAFNLVGSVRDQIREFRGTRVGRIVAGDTPVQLLDGPKLALHIVPFESFGRRDQVDIRSIPHQDLRPFNHVSGSTHRYNIDGYLRHAQIYKDGCTDAYAQLFRNGSIEAVNAEITRESENGVTINGHWIDNLTVDRATNYLDLLEEIGVSPPLAIMLSLTETSGIRIRAGTRSSRLPNPAQHLIERDTILAPEIVVNEYGHEITDVLRPLLDSVWQSSGHTQSQSYDEEGRWNIH